MTDWLRGPRRFRVLAFAILGIAVLGLPATALAADYTGHPAIGSWFGKAIQICATGVAPSACQAGNPASVLFMTPTLTTDGLFLGSDSFALGGPPFGPHTTAHGTWIPTNSNSIAADYVFMSNPYPAVANSIAALRLSWRATVVSADTMVGFVNGYVFSPLPLTWTPLGEGQFPAFPPEANPVVTPQVFVTDPSTCRTDGCPLVFKFTIKRVVP